MINRFKGTIEKNDSYRARASFDASYEFVKGLTFKTSVAADYSQQNQNLFRPSYLDEYNESYSGGQNRESSDVVERKPANLQAHFQK